MGAGGGGKAPPGPRGSGRRAWSWDSGLQDGARGSLCGFNPQAVGISLRWPQDPHPGPERTAGSPATSSRLFPSPQGLVGHMAAWGPLTSPASPPATPQLPRRPSPAPLDHKYPLPALQLRSGVADLPTGGPAPREEDGPCTPAVRRSVDYFPPPRPAEGLLCLEVAWMEEAPSC